MTQHKGTARSDTILGWHHEEGQIAPLDILGMLRVVWHGKWLILCSTLIVVGLAGFYAFRIAQPQYAATSTLQMQHSANPRADMSPSPDANDIALNTMVALVRSDPVLTNVIAKLDLLSDTEFNRYLASPRPFALRSLRTSVRHLLSGTSEIEPDATAVLEKTIQNLRGALDAGRWPETYIVQITASSADPAKAALLANTTAAQFLAHTQTLQRRARTEAENQLQSRVNALRTQLERQEMEAAALIATAQLQEGSGLDTLSAQILAADQDLIATRNAVAIREIAPEAASARNAAEIVQLREKASNLAALRERLSAQLSAQSAGMAQLHQIQLQADATRQLYQTFLARLHDNRIQQGLITPNDARITPASDGAYVGPRKILIMTIATMLGATLGVVAVAVQHNMRKGVIDARSLRHATGLPVLAQLSSEALRSLRKGRRAFPLPPQSALFVAARNLLTAIALTTRGRTAQVILSTSSIHAEGKTLQAIALAHAIARTGKRVVLIGADDTNAVLGSVTKADVFQKARESWHIMQAGAHDASLGADILVLPDFSDQLATSSPDGLADRLRKLRDTYDHIVIDAPPVLRSPDALVLASHADAIIYAVRWSKTPLDLVQRGLEMFDDIGLPVTGLVLAGVNLRKLRKLSDDPCITAAETVQAI